ncbi:hypothetical protein BaOVIS_014480 [Babesia ovis]|uniref:Uncharacterized protein n=1 Tax=Babesia ovis TaxID=5869 RepID=A0A9W5WUN2_BABOV|nr:hypothetical protein BaOVIS_014480 [Babesia ovis]
MDSEEREEQVVVTRLDDIGSLSQISSISVLTPVGSRQLDTTTLRGNNNMLPLESMVSNQRSERSHYRIGIVNPDNQPIGQSGYKQRSGSYRAKHKHVWEDDADAINPMNIPISGSGAGKEQNGEQIINNTVDLVNMIQHSKLNGVNVFEEDINDRSRFIDVHNIHHANKLYLSNPNISNMNGVPPPEPVIILEPFGTEEGNKASLECESIILQQIALNDEGGYDISTHIRDVDHTTVMIHCDQSHNGSLTMELVCDSTRSNQGNGNKEFGFHSGVESINEREYITKHNPHPTDTKADKTLQSCFENDPGLIGTEQGGCNGRNNISSVQSEHKSHNATPLQENNGANSGNGSVDSWLDKQRNIFMCEEKHPNSDSSPCGCHWSMSNGNMTSMDNTSRSDGYVNHVNLNNDKASCRRVNGTGDQYDSTSNGMDRLEIDGRMYGVQMPNTTKGGYQLQRHMSDCHDSSNNSQDGKEHLLFRKCSSMDVTPQSRSEYTEQPYEQKSGSGIFGFINNFKQQKQIDFDLPPLPMYDIVEGVTPGKYETEERHNDKAADSSEITCENLMSNQVPRERILFYGFYGNRCKNYDMKRPLEFRHTSRCTVTPQELGFDSAESFNRSLNAKSEIIVRPPVTLGGPVFFRANVAKSVLCSQRFITNTVFQINWYENSLLRKRRASCLGC